MKKRLLVTAIALASATPAVAFTVNDAQSNAMAGTGVANSAERNPAFYAPSRSRRDTWRLRLFSTTAYVNDPEDFFGALADFVDDDLDVITSFEMGEANDVLSDLIGQANDTETAAIAFNNDPNDSAKLTALENASVALGDSNTAARVQVNKADNVVNVADRNFSNLSSRPMDVGLLASLGVDVPLQSLPFSLNLDNQAKFGAQFNYEKNDAGKFTDITDDSLEYLNRLSDVNNSLQTLIDKAETLQTTPNQANQDAFDAALSDYQNTAGTLNASTANGSIDGGELKISLDSNDFDSTVDILGSNVTSLKLGVGQRMEFRTGTLSVGTVLKGQVIQVFGQRVDVEEASKIDADYIAENTEQYIAGNMDLGVAYELADDRFGHFTFGGSVQDLFPMSFEAGNGEAVDFNPKARVGLAHRTDLTLLSLDLDVTENEPAGYGVTTRYLGLGAEFNAWNWAAIRTGYRHNMAVEDDSIVSAGFALTPWILNMDLSAWMRPEFDSAEDLARSAGLSADVSMRW